MSSQTPVSTTTGYSFGKAKKKKKPTEISSKEDDMIVGWNITQTEISSKIEKMEEIRLGCGIVTNRGGGNIKLELFLLSHWLSNLFHSTMVRDGGARWWNRWVMEICKDQSSNVHKGKHKRGLETAVRGCGGRVYEWAGLGLFVKKMGTRTFHY